MANRGSVYQRVGGVKPRRNIFDLTHRVNTTCDMGQLIPVGIIDCIPGDTFDIKCELVVRFQPLVAPLLHQITATVHYFFCPYRVLWRPPTRDDEGKSLPGFASQTDYARNWETFIRQNTVEHQQVDSHGNPIPFFPLPTYFDFFPTGESYNELTSPRSLWDYFGFPPFNSSLANIHPSAPLPVGLQPYIAENTNRDGFDYPNPFPWLMYNTVFNEYYRDQDLQSPVNVVNWTVLHRNWKQDYFTAARPFRQKGPGVGMPVDFFSAVDAGSGLELTPGFLNLGLSGINNGQFGPQVAVSPYIPAGTDMQVINRGSSQGPVNTNTRIGVQVSSPVTIPPPGSSGEPNVTNGVATFDVGDLRFSFQLTKYEERRARAGTRYTEIIRAHYGEAPTDARLDRPEYIGGVKMPVVISEVLQTSQTDPSTGNVLGQMGGHGVTADRDRIARYHVQEFGIIMALFSCMPKPSYQDGINRQWVRRSPIDFYWPEFSLLSEQAINHSEILSCLPFLSQYVSRGLPTGSPYWVNASYDKTVFGFVGQYDEYRIMPDLATSEMRSLSRAQVNSALVGNYDKQLSYWNLTRKFGWNFVSDEGGTADHIGIGAGVMLNTEFVTCIPRKDIFLVPSKPGLIVNVNHRIRATRPLPLIAEPSLVDHN